MDLSNLHVQSNQEKKNMFQPGYFFLIQFIFSQNMV